MHIALSQRGEAWVRGEFLGVIQEDGTLEQAYGERGATRALTTRARRYVALHVAGRMPGLDRRVAVYAGMKEEYDAGTLQIGVEVGLTGAWDDGQWHPVAFSLTRQDAEQTLGRIRRDQGGTLETSAGPYTLRVVGLARHLAREREWEALLAGQEEALVEGLAHGHYGLNDRGPRAALDTIRALLAEPSPRPEAWQERARIALRILPGS